MSTPRNPRWRHRLTSCLRWAMAGGVAAVILAPVSMADPVAPEAHPKPTVVLVHGAWSDATIWSSVVERLKHRGYAVVVPPNPLRGVAADSATIAGVLHATPGPVVLVGHSYGGFVITNAAADNPNVKARVYVDAYIPDAGETVQALGMKFPGSQVTPDALNFVPPRGGVPEVFVKPERFPAIMANDLPATKGALLASKQLPILAPALQESSQASAVSDVPTYALVGTQDNAIPVATQDFMAQRVNATTVHVPAAHLSMVSQPDAVTDLVVRAANQVH